VHRRGLIWRSTLAAIYVGWALVCSFVFGGGMPVLAFFGVWAAVWIGFSLFWRWADETRTSLLRRRGYY
jgi:hypothetical protein